MPDESRLLEVGDRVWVHSDPDFEADCEAVVVEIEEEHTAWIATDPDVPRSTFEDQHFHASFSRHMNENIPYVVLLESKDRTPENKLKGLAKFLRRIEENV